jgi:prepilin-type N-terminal cleavage/methylation domain-containing protein
MISSRTSRSRISCRGFTLVELLITISITLVLVTVTFILGGKFREKTRKVVCMGKMRQIGSAVAARAMDRNDIPYTKQEIGNSFYREWRDPLSLCQVLDEYLSGHEVWMSPGAPSRLAPFKNTYCWSVSTRLTDKDKDGGFSKLNPGDSILWNNFNLTIPSVYNVPEPDNKAGPRNPGARYRIIPWSDGVHHLRADLAIRLINTQ